MSIIRVRNRSQFVSIDQAVLADLSLSWEAKGLHTYLLSRFDDWHVSVAHLVKSNPHAGRDKIYRMLGELIAHGYAERVVVRSDAGRVIRYDYEVFENSRVSNSQPVDNFAQLPEKPLTAEPLTAKPTRTTTELKSILKKPSYTENNWLDKDWFPSLAVLEILRARGIEMDFIERLVPEFILYWRERNPRAGDWDRRFVLHVRYLDEHPDDPQNLLRAPQR